MFFKPDRKLIVFLSEFFCVFAKRRFAIPLTLCFAKFLLQVVVGSLQVLSPLKITEGQSFIVQTHMEICQPSDASVSGDHYLMLVVSWDRTQLEVHNPIFKDVNGTPCIRILKYNTTIYMHGLLVCW